MQEAGIDEADVIETDGRRILALVGSTLVYVDIDGPMREARQPSTWTTERASTRPRCSSTVTGCMVVQAPGWH